MTDPFADRLAAVVEERRSQLCLGLDPDPARLPAEATAAGGDPRESAADATVAHCTALIEATASVCVAAKLQLACFERLGAPGWRALEEVAGAARAAGLLVIADGKRGDVPVSAAAYAQSLFGETPTPWGAVPGLRADAATLNPLLGHDAIEPLIAAAAATGGGVFVLVRTSNPGAADLLDLPAPRAPLFERLAAIVAANASRLAGSSGLSGAGAVIGATAPEHLGGLRALMPEAIFLVPGVGAQGGDVASLAPGLGAHPASLLVTASRAVADARNPREAAERLRSEAWSLERR